MASTTGVSSEALNPETGNPLAPRLAVLAAALLFSTGGAAVKATDLPALQVAALRCALAVPVLALALPQARRGWTWRGWLVGLAYAGVITLYVVANKLTTAANAIFLQSTAPLWVLLLSPWLLKERIRRADLAFMVALAAGMALFFVGFDAPTETAPRPALGNLVGTVAGVCWALTILGLRWLEGSGGGNAAGRSAAAVLQGNLLAAGLSLAAIGLLGGSGWQAANPVDWVVVAYLGAVQIGLAYVFLTFGLRRVPAFETSLLLLMDPVLNPLWAWWLHGEIPGLWSRAGCLVILLAMVVRTLGARGRRSAGRR